MKRIIIQEEISITEEELNEVTKGFEDIPDTFGMGIGGKMLDKKGIIREVTNLTYIGKQILLMKYEFKKWKESQGIPAQSQQKGAK